VTAKILLSKKDQEKKDLKEEDFKEDQRSTTRQQIVAAIRAEGFSPLGGLGLVDMTHSGAAGEALDCVIS
jgi:hypothetical protein